MNPTWYIASISRDREPRLTAWSGTLYRALPRWYSRTLRASYGAPPGLDMAALEEELKHLIIDALTLEDVCAADIEPTAPLFVTGLGLDSIDALELAMAIEKRYGVRFAASDAQNARIFASLRSLSQHIADTLRGPLSPAQAHE